MLVKLITASASATRASRAVISLTRSGVRWDSRVIAFGAMMDEPYEEGSLST